MCTLIAAWTWDQDPWDPPSQVFWGDGRSATVEDYRKHRFDTYEIAETDDGIEKRIFRWLVADIRFDAFSRRWFLVPPDGDLIALQISDPDATDAEIVSELEDLPRVWRARIWRGGSFKNTAEIEQVRSGLL